MTTNAADPVTLAADGVYFDAESGRYHRIEDGDDDSEDVTAVGRDAAAAPSPPTASDDSLFASFSEAVLPGSAADQKLDQSFRKWSGLIPGSSFTTWQPAGKEEIRKRHTVSGLFQVPMPNPQLPQPVS
jgi:hypothetical protein